MPCLECVVYEIKADVLGDFRKLNNLVRTTASAWDGFVSLTTLQSSETKTQFVDLVIWQDRKAALAAAEKFPKSAEIAPMMLAIEKVTFMGHFEIDETFANPEKLEGELVEIALGAISQDKVSQLPALKDALFSQVRKQSGLNALSSVSQTHDDKLINLDVLDWKDKQSADAAIQLIHKSDACGAFMSAFSQDLYFAHMQKFAA